MSKIETIPAGKIKCYVTGKLRLDTPEEHIRQRMARSLVEEYGYNKEDMGIERIIVMGRAKKRADIVIYRKGCSHDLEHIHILVEAKRESIKPSNIDSGVDQLHGYLSATPNSRFGLWVGSEVLAYQKNEVNGSLKFEDCGDIPLASGEEEPEISFDNLVPATDALKDVFKRCHNYIAANQGGSKESAFHEFLKITFCKVFDERNSSSPRFFVSQKERKSKKGQADVFSRLAELFQEVCEEYGYIFGEEEAIKLKPNVAVYIVRELQKYTLLDTDFDYKGQAYEEIVGSNSRGDRGEFFTPRNLCALTVDILKVIVGEEMFNKIKLIDPSCGTGGFLRSYIYRLHNDLLKVEKAKWKDGKKAKEKAKDRLKAICDKNVFGIDFNPVLVRAAQMNLVMHGDGSSNIFHENSLLSFGEWGAETRQKVKDGSFDAIITNPPFGEDLSVDDSHVLGQYEISSFGRNNIKAEMAPQELFIERCYRLLKGDGLLLVITPDNIVSNPSYRHIRTWILLKFQIIASISLPTEMFQPHTGTQTTLLVLKKLNKPYADVSGLISKAGPQPIFMSVPKKIGHDQRGNLLPARDGDGNIILEKIETSRLVRKSDGSLQEETLIHHEQLADDQLPTVLENFKVWFKENKGAL